MVRHNEAWWSERVSELDAGVTASEIAATHGVREKTLLWWKSELSRRARRSAKAQRLVPVVIRGASESAPAVAVALDVSLETKRGRLTVRGAVEASHLSALALALRP
jgi:transposase-like protein